MRDAHAHALMKGYSWDHAAVTHSESFADLCRDDRPLRLVLPWEEVALALRAAAGLSTCALAPALLLVLQSSIGEAVF